MSVKLKISLVFLLVLAMFGVSAVSIPQQPKTASAASGPYTLRVIYVDPDGNSIANDDVYTTKADGKYNLNIVTITGYNFYSSTLPLAGTLTEDATMTMVYEPVKLQIRVIFVDEDGVAIKGAQTKTYYVTLHDYVQLDLSKIKIDGYRYKENNEIIPLTAVGNITVKLTYVKDDGAAEGRCSSAFDGGDTGALAFGLSSLAVIGIILKLRRRKNG